MIRNISFEMPNLLYCSNREEDFKDHFEAHLHGNYEVYLLKEGEVTYFVEGTNYSASPGDLFITNSRELHTPIIKHGCYDREYIQFNKYFLSGLIEVQGNLLQAFEGREPGKFNKIEEKLVKAYGIDILFNELNDACHNKDHYQNIEIQCLMMELIISINRIFEKELLNTEFQIKQNSKVQHILRYINENLTEKLTLEQLENELFMNKYYLCHLFKNNTGVSIYEYIINKRILLAKELILKDIPIMTVYHEVGFDDYSSFYKAFVKIEKKSPKLFFKEHQLVRRELEVL